MAMEKRYKDYYGEIVEHINNLSLEYDNRKAIDSIIGFVNWQVGTYGLDKSEYIPLLMEQVRDGMSIWARGIVDEDLLCAALADLVGDATWNSREQQPEEKSLAELMPECLRTDEAIGVFQKGIDEGMIEKTPTGLIWHGSKQLLAYFAEKMSNKFHMLNKIDENGKIMISWKPFEEMFCLKGLSTAKRNWMRIYTNFSPTDSERVDALF